MQVVDRNGRLKVEVTNFIEEVTIGVTTITGGVSGRALYDNAGVLGELNLASIYVPLTRTLTINGTTQDLSADRTFTISTGITIGTTAITSGTVGRVLFQGSGSVVSQSTNLFFDAANNRLGVNTSTPTQALDVNGQSVFRDALTISNGGDRGTLSWGGGTFYIQSLGTQDMSLVIPSGAKPLIIKATTGNVLINTTTDAGYKLDVNGTARVQGNVTAIGAIGSVIEHTALTNYNGFGGFQLNVLGGIERAFVKLQPNSGEFKIGTASGGGYFLTLHSAGSEAMRVFTTGNVAINTTTDAGYKLDVNGTARVQGALTVTGQLTFVGATQMIFNGAFFNNSNDRNHFGGAVSISTFLRIGTNANTVASAILQADSTTKGFLPPRMTTTEKNAIATPATGLMVYDNVLNRPCFYDGTTWITL